MVSGLISFDDCENERFRVCAAGFVGDVRKAREEAFVEAVGERMALSLVTMAALRVCVERSAWFSFLVSCSFRRRRRIDSGVGDEDEIGNWRFYAEYLAQWSSDGNDQDSGSRRRSHLVMTQSHPRRKIIRYRQDVS